MYRNQEIKRTTYWSFVFDGNKELGTAMGKRGVKGADTVKRKNNSRNSDVGKVVEKPKRLYPENVK